MANGHLGSEMSVTIHCSENTSAQAEIELAKRRVEVTEISHLLVYYRC
jgi:hypothetical protein